MGLPHVPRLSSPDRVLNQAQDNIANAVDRLSGVEILDGQLLRDVVLASGVANQVPHKLGRALIGYEVVRRNAQAIIWDTAADDKFVTMRASATVTVTLWVF